MNDLKEQLEKVNDLLLNTNLSFMEKIELKDIKIELERKLGLMNNGDYDYEECENCSA
jgi:CO dehydrogenase/acetyl-CoA synthase delta subunit